MQGSDSPTHRCRLALYVALFSLGLRVLWVLFAVVTPVSDFDGYDFLAWRWVTEGEFGYHMGLAYRTPGYPAFLAVVYTLFGHSWKAAGVANAVLGGVTSGLLVLLAAKLVSRRAAVAAGLLHAGSPVAVAYVPVIASGNLGVLLIVASLLLLRESHDQTGWRECLLTGASGFLLALLVLTRPAALLMAPAFVVLALYSPPHRAWRPRGAAVFVLLAVLGFAPWSIRNTRLGLSPLTVSTSGGVAVLWDISPHAFPGEGGRIPRRMRHLPEDERHWACLDAAFGWIRRNPCQYLRMCRARAVRFLGTQPDHWAASYLWPSRENDRAVQTALESARRGESLPSSVRQTYQRNLSRARQCLRRYRIVVVPVMLTGLCLALLRLRSFAYVVLPVLCYTGGLVLTCAIGRYRLLSEVLLFVPMAAVLSDVGFGTNDLGTSPSRRAKTVIVIAVLLLSVFIHATHILEPLQRFPTPYATRNNGWPPRYKVFLMHCSVLLESSVAAWPQRPEASIAALQSPDGGILGPVEAGQSGETRDV